MYLSLKNTGAERGFIALYDRDSNELVYKVKKGFDDSKADIEVSYNIIDKVMKESRTITVGNASEEMPSESVYAFDLKSVICAPLIGQQGTMGCIYIDNSSYTENFTLDDRFLMNIISRHVAITVENVILYQKVRQEREQLKKQLAIQEDIIIESDNMVELYKDVEKIARFNVNVLILGETGTGKELVRPQSIYKFSRRKGESNTMSQGRRT